MLTVHLTKTSDEDIFQYVIKETSNSDPRHNPNHFYCISTINKSLPSFKHNMINQPRNVSRPKIPNPMPKSKTMYPYPNQKGIIHPVSQKLKMRTPISKLLSMIGIQEQNSYTNSLASLNLKRNLKRKINV